MASHGFVVLCWTNHDNVVHCQTNHSVQEGSEDADNLSPNESPCPSGCQIILEIQVSNCR